MKPGNKGRERYMMLCALFYVAMILATIIATHYLSRIKHAPADVAPFSARA